MIFVNCIALPISSHLNIGIFGIDHALIEVGNGKIQTNDAKLILQVHDELIVEASRSDAEAAAAILKNEMEHAATTRVPLTVEVAMGQSWYEAKQ